MRFGYLIAAFTRVPEAWRTPSCAIFEIAAAETLPARWLEEGLSKIAKN